MLHALDETDVEFPRLGLEDPALHRDTGLHQTQQAATGDLGVGILHRRDHPRHPGTHQRVGARRGAAEMTAGLEGHVGGGAACILAGLAQGMDLGVRLAGADVPALADHLAVLDQHAADARIRMGGVQPLARQFQGAGHVQRVGGVHSLAGSRARRSISSRNSLRSWKRR